MQHASSVVRRTDPARLAFLVLGAIAMALSLQLAARLFVKSMGGIAPVASEIAVRLG